VRPAFDAAAPWLAPLRPWLDRLPPGAPAAEALNAIADPASPRFVPQAALPDGEAYEAFIARTASVPTRDNLHDLFNGLVWQRHPALKRRLNQLQAAAIARHGIGPVRGALRDALTLFDEFGALWPDAPIPLLDALRRRDWHALFVTRRQLWAASVPELFGHALIEQLAQAPRQGLTAHVAIGDPQGWTAADWAAKPFLPLPVLGIPGWWPPNEDPAFYADTRVFRPARP
jgi:hypothetical protein